METLIKFNENLHQTVLNVFNTIGMNQKESAYRQCLYNKLTNIYPPGSVRQEVPFTRPVNTVSRHFHRAHSQMICQKRVDIILCLPDGNWVILELKATLHLTDRDENQLREYFRMVQASGLPCQHGYLINFPKTTSIPEIKYIRY